MVKEVSEVLPECAKSVVGECSSGESETEGTSVLTKSGVPLDVMQVSGPPIPLRKFLCVLILRNNFVVD